MSRHSISTTLALGALALALVCGAARAHPDPVALGGRVEAGDLAQVREWLNAGLDPNAMADRIGTGLMIAAWNGDLPMMALFVARGADVNKINTLGEQALMHAAWRGKADAVKWLLARGARINRESMQWSAIHYAAFAGQDKVVALLLENGADINARSTNGSSPLMMAVYEGHERTVRQLVARGADRSVKNDRGEGALEWAFKFQRLSIARLVSAPQEFAAAANEPKSRWGAPMRSLREGEAISAPPAMAAPDPAGEKIEELMRMRDALAYRGMKDAVSKLDKRIAALRAQRARAQRTTPATAVLEITANRNLPENQRMRVIFEAGGPPP